LETIDTGSDRHGASRRDTLVASLIAVAAITAMGTHGINESCAF
jgi:hypothetical protein